MNNQLIEKVIKSDNGTCPPLIYQNPILDRAVATGLSKSFMKIIKVSGRNSNSNNNLRFSVLENIKRLCKVNPENHINVDENFTELLTETYQKSLEECSSSDTETTDQLLDQFLLRRLKGIDMDFSMKSSVNPEVIQALSNLDENGIYISQTRISYIHWNAHNQKCSNVLKNIWYNNNTRHATFPQTLVDDVSVKIKSEIEEILLKTCLDILNNEDINFDAILASYCSNSPISQLVRNCSVSPECFQICCSIINHVFVMKDFDGRILNFITSFIYHVKLNSPCVSVAMLYPNHLCNLVLLLDLDIQELPDTIRNGYKDIVTAHLNTLHKESVNDLILLLSHFPNWFDVYFEHKDN